MNKTAKFKNQKNVWWLGITSFFTDISSEMIFPVMPFFLKNILDAPFAVIGLIDGAADAASSILKYVSGWISDKFEKRKTLTLIGYSISAISKLFFWLATSWVMVLVFRILDRIGKGIRTSSRDALIAESISETERGKYFGLHRTMDTAGAVIGVLIAGLILYWFSKLDALGNVFNYDKVIRLILFLSFIPALIGVIVLSIFVKDIVKKFSASKQKLFNFYGFSSKFYLGIFILGLFSFGNISYSFFLLKAQNIGLAIFLVPLAYLIYNLAYALFSFPAGKLSDKIGRIKILIISFFVFGITLIGFAIVKNNFFIFPLFILYGAFIGINDAVIKAFISDISDQSRLGESFGFYYMLTGFLTFIGNLIFGVLWDKAGNQTPFIWASIFVFISTVLLGYFFKSHSQIRQVYGAETFKGYR